MFARRKIFPTPPDGNVSFKKTTLLTILSVSILLITLILSITFAFTLDKNKASIWNHMWIYPTFIGTLITSLMIGITVATIKKNNAGLTSQVSYRIPRPHIRTNPHAVSPTSERSLRSSIREDSYASLSNSGESLRSSVFDDDLSNLPSRHSIGTSYDAPIELRERDMATQSMWDEDRDSSIGARSSIRNSSSRHSIGTSYDAPIELRERDMATQSMWDEQPESIYRDNSSDPVIPSRHSIGTSYDELETRDNSAQTNPMESLETACAKYNMKRR